MTATLVDYKHGYGSAFFSGAAAADTALVPGLYPVGIAGHPYILNTDPSAIESYGDGFKEESVALLRAQADQGRTAGEQSLSPSQFWRRSAETWHGGAGQSVFDRDISVPERFNTSKGVNPWTKYQLTLLNGTTNIRATGTSNLVGVAANSRFYVADGTTLTSTADLSTFTAVTGTPALQASALVTDGAKVFAAFAASGIYSVSTSVATSYVTGTVDNLGFAKGRLLASNAGALYNPVTAGALPAAFYTHPDAGWLWTAFAEGDSFIYAAGGTGDKSRIYRIGVQPDGTALTVPVVAASLPTGEKVRSLLGYLGFVLIGTDKGVRFATASDTGDLTLGSLVPTPGAVYALDATDRFVWFGWTNYDTTSSGLGRFDLQTINDGLAPAYATDLMATGQGTVRATGLVGTRRAFTVDGLGTFAEALTPVTSGVLRTGQINYGLSDPKVAVSVDLKHAPLPASASVGVAFSADRGTFDDLGSSATVGSVGPSESMSIGAVRAEEAELQFTLAASATAPVLTRWTLLSYPAPVGASVFILPLWLGQRITTLREIEEAMDPFAEYQFLRALHDTRELVTVQLGDLTFSGTLEEYVWIPEHTTFDHGWFDGTFIARIRRLQG